MGAQAQGSRAEKNTDVVRAQPLIYLAEKTLCRTAKIKCDVGLVRSTLWSIQGTSTKYPQLSHLKIQEHNDHCQAALGSMIFGARMIDSNAVEDTGSRRHLPNRPLKVAREE